MELSRYRAIFAFLVVGGLSAGVDVGVFLVLTWFGVQPVLASAIGFMSAFVINFKGNQQLVFRVRGNRGQLVRYIVLVVVNLGLSAGIVALGVALGVNPVAAKAISMVLIAAFNFIAMRLWVFPAAAERSDD